MEVEVYKTGERAFLRLGTEHVEVKDYKISSPMHGCTELEVVIRLQNDFTRFLTSATPEPLQQQNLKAASDCPNLQRIPSDSEWGKKIKACLDDCDCILEA